ncbi:RHS repeat-associated core domain-containing protein [Chitinophaga sp. LS1]|uniref:RHS repeat domain-containing protein n=1 Tax=Chitinophaga sp. LS1 TaxID=3051176 RepID=UPI002AAB1B88|nr:RHS repeat-associated core domain-containing protein [Chitinophaga sp. LS1]WPV66715.1 RHS repeat-associated core domain-containing protein [Chitinophaga sp. LS1]
MLSVYNYGDTAINSGDLSQTEAHLYGSSRLGMATMSVNVQDTTAEATTNITGLGTGKNIIFRRGKKFFELTNHLGNVQATLSDRKIQVSGNGTTIDYYNADVVSAQDYYPFGMIQPGRSYNAGGYRYGFNGKENDNEVKGEGNEQDYGMRVYDPRVGRFLSVDPLFNTYPHQSSYCFAANSPIILIDVDGAGPNLGDPPTKTAPVIKPTQSYTIRRIRTVTEIQEPPVEPSRFNISTLFTVIQIANGAANVLTYIFQPANGDYAGPGSKDGNEVPQNNLPYERITNDPNKLTEQDKQSARARLWTNLGTAQDLLFSSDISAQSTKDRAKDILKNMDVSDYIKRNIVTIAVADAVNLDGKHFRLIGINSSMIDQKSVMEELRASLKPGEILVPIMDLEREHAEVNVYEYAKRWGLTITSIDPSRPFCANCEELRRRNSTPTDTKMSKRKPKIKE